MVRPEIKRIEPICPAEVLEEAAAHEQLFRAQHNTHSDYAALWKAATEQPVEIPVKGTAFGRFCDGVIRSTANWVRLVVADTAILEIAREDWDTKNIVAKFAEDCKTFKIIAEVC